MTQTLGSYSFLPYLRNGVARLITTADSSAITAMRASVPVAVRLTGTAISGTNRTQDFPKTIEMYGPGDVIGIDKRAIVRRQPRPGSMNVETPFLAHIEFYDEDFCWRFTPAAPDTKRWRLRPWITLTVLAEGEFAEGGVPEAKTLPYIELPDDQTLAEKFPPADQLWAWAHVHVNGNLTASETGVVAADMSGVLSRLHGIIDQDPDRVYSRLVCPRKLAPRTTYHAFLIPTFENGRCAGLGEPNSAPSATHSAWADYQGKPRRNRFCYFDRWHFKTGGSGSFEELVRILIPKPVDSRVGTRDVDLRRPGSNLPGFRYEAPLRGVLKLGGALKVPDCNLTGAEKEVRETYEEWDATYPHELQSNLATLLNLADDYNTRTPASAHRQTKLVATTDDGDCDPVITPPIYGQWHALATRVLKNESGARLPNDRNWLHQLNLDPRHRIAAGLGTAIMVREQERLMAASWAQVGAVLEANRRIRLAQLAKQTGWSWFHKQIKPLHAVDKARSLQMAAPMQLRMMIDGKTVWGTLLESQLQPAALSIVTRRAFRPMTRVNRFIANAKRPQELFQRIGTGTFRPAPDKSVPSGILTIDKLRPVGRPTGLTAPVERAVGIGGERISADTVDDLPRNSSFTLITGMTDAAARAGSSDSVEATRFKDALRNGFAMIDESFAVSAVTPKKPVDITRLARAVIDALDPSVTIPRRVKQRVKIPPKLAADLNDDPMVEAVAYPVIDEPLYIPLTKISPELFLPRINLIPPNSITLLETNRPFIESVCVGANHEWCREALWQEYPTDQRGSPLRQFWSVAESLDAATIDEAEREKRRDIAPIDKWLAKSPLGVHDPAVRGTGRKKRENIVLTVRGDLLVRYPTVVVTARRAQWQTANRRINNSVERVMVPLTDSEEDHPPKEKMRTPVFEAKVEPDIYFFGFDLTENDVRGGTGEKQNDDPGWFFVLQERPGEPRFGLDEGASTELEVWNDLTWQRIQPANAAQAFTYIQIDNSTPTLSLSSDPLETDDAEKIEQRSDDLRVMWRKEMSSADVAYMLHQAPVLVAVHASEMIRRDTKCEEADD